MRARLEADARLGICVVEVEFDAPLGVFGRLSEREDANGEVRAQVLGETEAATVGRSVCFEIGVGVNDPFGAGSDCA